MAEHSGRAKPSVILIREWERQMSSSGCCGRLEGDFLFGPKERCFPERRQTMEEMGPLYRELRTQYGDSVEIHVVDPRNLVTIVGMLLRAIRGYGLPIVEAFRTLFGIQVTSVVVNGRLLAKGRWPEADEVRLALGDPPTSKGIYGGVA